MAVVERAVEPEPVDFEDLVDDLPSSTDWIQAGAVVLASILLAIVANRIARRIGERTIGPGFASLLIARTLGYVIVVVGFVYALGSLGVRIAPLLRALGLVGLVLALALQGVVENFFGGPILQSRRPFTIGDTVELGDRVGVVKDIDSRSRGQARSRRDVDPGAQLQGARGPDRHLHDRAGRSTLPTTPISNVPPG